MNNFINIKEIEKEIELELIASMKRNLSRHLKEEAKTGFDYSQWQAETLKELKRFQRENKSIVRERTTGLNTEIRKQLQNELKQGSKTELKRYKKAMGDRYLANKNLSHSFFKLNDKKLISLIEEIQNGTKNANYGALRMMNDQYRKVISKATMFSNYGAVSPKKSIDMATKEFLAAGINCIEYKNGRRVNIADYCDMALRTANTRAQLIGEGQFRQEIGEHLVKPTKHGTSCEKCARWEGRILIDDVYSSGSKKDGKYPLLSEAMTQGFFHPRCRHGLPTYYKEIDDIQFDEHGATEETMKQYQEDLNWINNNIQKYERLAIGSLDEENIKKYKEKKLFYEKKKEDVLKIVEMPLNYVDVTDKWKENATPNSHKILDRNYYIDLKGNRYDVDGKNVVLDYSKEEKEIAEWLENTLGGELYMVPRVNNPSGIQTSDYIFRNSKWDLKTITGNGKQVLYHSVYKKKAQSNNFIFELSSSKLDMNEIIEQIDKLYKRKDVTFVNEIIVKKNDDFLIFKRK